MTNGLTRGVPVQDLPENQDPSVRYTVNEVTGEITRWAEPEESKAKPKAKPKAKADEPADVEESGDAGDEVPVEVAATSVRELGS